jgi:metallophosphoesterase superfamily enzyme
MSRKRRTRSRGPARRTETGVYPSPAERQRIIERRDALLQQVITALVVHQGDPRKIARLSRKYATEEIALVLTILQSRSTGAETMGQGGDLRGL